MEFFQRITFKKMFELFEYFAYSNKKRRKGKIELGLLLVINRFLINRHFPLFVFLFLCIFLVQEVAEY